MTKTKLLTMTLSLMLSVIAANLLAQIKTPAPSPFAKLEQKVGLTDVTIEYSRPGVKDREIFGNLVPYGKIWRTGANYSTKLSFSNDVKLEGKEIPAGTYALYTKPGEKEWTIMIYKDLKLGGYVARYDAAEELVQFNVTPKKIGMSVESFTIDVNDLRNNSATISLTWSDVTVPIKLTVDTDSGVISQIEKFAKNPERSLASDYFASAAYYHGMNKELDKALTWIDKAIEIRPDAFWIIRKKAQIQADMGKYKDAISSAEKSKKIAMEAKNDDYVRMNNQSIAEWKKKI